MMKSLFDEFLRRQLDPPLAANMKDSEIAAYHERISHGECLCDRCVKYHNIDLDSYLGVDPEEGDSDLGGEQ